MITSTIFHNFLSLVLSRKVWMMILVMLSLSMTGVAGVPEDTCGNITISGSYTMIANVTSAGTCYNINASNVILDGNGYMINYSTIIAGNGIIVSGSADNVTIRNAIIKKGNATPTDSSAILYQTGSNLGTIENNTIDTSIGSLNSYGIDSYGVGAIIQNTISSSSSHGIYLENPSDGSNVSNNIINTTSGKGINFYYSSINIANNNIITTTSGDGIFFEISHNNILNNNTILTTAANGEGIVVYSSNNIEVSNGSIISNVGKEYSLFSSSNVTFINTNFTTRKIEFSTANISWFNYSNNTGITFVSNNVSTVDKVINRTLLNWTVSNITFNESVTSGTVTSTYNVTGLSPSTIYYVYNNTVLEVTNTTDSNGKLILFAESLSTTPITIKITSDVPTSSCAQIGNTFNLSSDTNISQTTTWDNCNFEINGNIYINDNGTLNLYNSTLSFNESYSNQYNINLFNYNGSESNGSLIIESSNLGVTNYSNTVEYNWQINSTKSSSKIRHILINNSVLDSCGKNGTFNTYDWGREVACVYGFRLDQASMINNSVFNNITMAIHTETGGVGGFSNIYNNTFNTRNGNDNRAVINTYSNSNPVNWTYIINNTFNNLAFINYLDAIDAGKNAGYLYIYRNHFNNFNLSGTYTINFNGNSFNFQSIIQNNVFNNTHRTIVLDIIGQYTIVRNNIMNCGIGTNYCGLIMGSNYKWNHTEVTGNIAYNTTDTVILGGVPSYGIFHNNWTFKNNSFYTALTAHSTYQGTFQNSLFQDNYLSGTRQNIGFNWVNATVGGAYAGNDTNNTYINNTLFNFSTAIKLRGANNLTFIDTNITASSTYDINLNGNNINITFINTNIDNSKIAISSGDIFKNNYYSDINVTNSTGSPISGATITFTNNVNVSYPSIDRTGNTVVSYTTGDDGHTPLPIGNDSTTVVLMNMSKNSTSQENMTYIVNVNDSSYIYPNINTSINSTGYNSPQQPVTSATITPNSSWYRPDPNTYQNTTTIQLPASTNWSILPDITISVNAGSDKDLTTSWSGTAQVNFNTTIPEWSSQTIHLRHDGKTVDTKAANATGFVTFTYTGLNQTFNVTNETQYNISGYVNDTLGAAINAVSIVNGTNSTTTNATGYYNISSMTNGTYNFTYSKAGYVTNYKEIIINGADVVNQNVTLIASEAQFTKVDFMWWD